MLTFNFPSLTKSPIELELTDFTPAPEYDADGSFIPLTFGKALVLINLLTNAVCFCSNYDDETEEWQSVLRGTCTPETSGILFEYYDNNI